MLHGAANRSSRDPTGEKVEQQDPDYHHQLVSGRGGAAGGDWSVCVVQEEPHQVQQNVVGAEQGRKEKEKEEEQKGAAIDCVYCDRYIMFQIVVLLL